MINWLARTLGTAAIFCALISVSTSYANPSLKDYGTLPEIQLITISPSGNLVAFRKITDESDLIIVLSLDTNKVLRALDVSALNPDSIYFLNEETTGFSCIQGHKSGRV